MDRAVYTRMSELEEAHWWFAGRRQIVADVLRRIVGLKPGARILEAGAGTGGNLAMLREFGAVDAFEYDAAARALACDKTGVRVEAGALPDAVPFEDGGYDAVLLLDVLEHVEQDAEALAVLGRRLGPDGRLVVTVPAFPLLWSAHDVRHHHFRRYTRATLTDAARAAGLSVERSFYFNGFLLPVAVGLRKLKAWLGRESPDDLMPGPTLNGALNMVFAAERHLIGRIPFPAGLSVGAVLRAGPTANAQNAPQGSGPRAVA
ncbi:MAG: class I SAM-dependent methyltransferase [Pseudomonadota bacterium]